MRPSVTTLAMDARQSAADVVARHKKQASFRLYAVLAPCLEICERCTRNPADIAEIEALFRQQPHDGSRRYVEAGSDIFVLVCRFVFSGTNRSNAIRYSQCLREAVKLGIASEDLAAWLRHNGGVNALYFRRPLASSTSTARTLRLARSITFPRDKPFTLTLQWGTENAFRVLDGKREAAE